MQGCMMGCELELQSGPARLADAAVEGAATAHAWHAHAGRKGRRCGRGRRARRLWGGRRCGRRRCPPAARPRALQRRQRLCCVAGVCCAQAPALCQVPWTHPFSRR
jgi:hypothetical protein